ncbi:uncharacterized protein [Primulina eburnea]|uniref:uncharacterized protein n=1 Tax=Primulina eburnea TaxID=1245227 RepID=UPI003C6C2CD9
MLIAVGLDGNNQILPLAFAIVDEETYDSWKWFLELLCKHVVRGSTCLCLISNRHRGIINAVEEIPDFRHPRGVHHFCLRHVCSNFNTHFKNVHLKDLCWKAGTQHQIRKFDAIMDEIKNLESRAFVYLSEIDKHKWTLAHDGGWRRGVMTSNLSECLNSVLKGARRLPVSALVQLTFNRCVHYFIDRITRRQRMIQSNQPWPDYAFRLYEKWSSRSSEHTVVRTEIRDQSEPVVTGGRQGRGERVQVVTLRLNECSCGKWTIFGIPCSHAICTAKWYGLDPTQFVQRWFEMSEYIDTYEGRFRPIADEEYWDEPTFELCHNPNRRERRRKGRDRTTRIRNEMDRPSTRERQCIQREISTQQRRNQNM